MRLDIHKLFHTLWTKAVGTEDYVKKEWIDLQTKIEGLEYEIKESKKDRNN